jgi:hypothetical protein
LLPIIISFLIAKLNWPHPNPSQERGAKILKKEVLSFGEDLGEAKKCDNVIINLLLLLFQNNL